MIFDNVVLFLIATILVTILSVIVSLFREELLRKRKIERKAKQREQLAHETRMIQASASQDMQKLQKAVQEEFSKPVVEPYYQKSKPVVTNSTPVRTAPVSRSHSTRNTRSSSSSTTPTSSRSSYYDSGSSYGYGGGSDSGSCSGSDSGGSSGGCD